MSIYEKLYDWQKRIVDTFYEKENFGLFLKMGLGKTPLSLAFAEKNDCTKVIVITINAKALESKDDHGSWLYWGAQSKIPYEHKNKKDTAFDPNLPEILLVNYESLFCRERTGHTKCELRPNIVSFISSCKDHNVAIIVDESHKMKSLQSLQTLAINKIKSMLLLRAKKVYTYLLTGTPFTTGYIDLFSQLKTLGYPESKTQFIDQFCIRGNIRGLLGWQQPIVGYKNIDRLYDVLHKYAITIESKEVVDLPQQIFINHTSKISQEFKVFTNEYIQEKELYLFEKFHKLEITHKNENKRVGNPYFRNICNPDLSWLAETNGAFWMRARQISIGFQGNAESSKWFDRTRLEQLKTFLSENEDNYILFYNYTPELLELYEMCVKLGYNVDVYCGEIKSLVFYEKYAAQTPEQQLTNKKNIILSNFASGSTGKNWQAYNECIIFSIPLFKDYEQALARICRIGQKDTTFYHVFYQQNWLDQSMLKALKESTNYSLEMFNSDISRVQDILQ